MSTFFDRLREERERLGFNQDAFGAIGGVKRRSQVNYESGERAPDVEYLAAIAKVGADVQYIVTGERAFLALTPDEQMLLQRYRRLSGDEKLAMLSGGTPSKTPKLNVKGNVGNQVSVGAGSTLHSTVNMGNKTEKK